MITPGPGAAELDIFHMLEGLEQQRGAWDAYVKAVRASAEDPDDEFHEEANALLAGGLEYPGTEDEDPEGFGMDEPLEGEM
jgi:hypothetical protein